MFVTSPVGARGTTACRRGGGGGALSNKATFGRPDGPGLRSTLSSRCRRFTKTVGRRRTAVDRHQTAPESPLRGLESARPGVCRRIVTRPSQNEPNTPAFIADPTPTEISLHVGSCNAEPILYHTERVGRQIFFLTVVRSPPPPPLTEF